MLTREDLYRVRYGAQSRNLREPSVVMSRDTLMDARTITDYADYGRDPETILGMPVKIDAAIPRGQVRLEDRDGRRYPVIFDTPATRG